VPATLVPLTVHQGNNETISLTVTPDTPGDNLTAVTMLKIVWKDSRCVSDTDSTTKTLSSAVPAEITITTQTATLIVATAHIPASYTTSPHPYWWRLDVYVGAAHRTAIYGPVTVIDI